MNKSVILGILLGSLAAFPLDAAVDVQSFLVVKGQQFKQISSGAPTVDQPPFDFFSTVIGSATNVALRLPNGQARKLTLEGESWEFSKQFTNITQFDAAYPTGRYSFVIDTPEDGRVIPSLMLPRAPFPTVPRILNWTDLQTSEASQPLTITWGAFAGGTTNDFVMLQVFNGDDEGEPLFSSPSWLEETALNGKDISATIPGGTLQDGETYTARLLFVKRTSFNRTAIPGAVGFTGYYRETVFPIATLAEPPAAGRIQFSASNYTVSENGSPATIVVTRSGSSGVVSVTLATSNGTAIAGNDYVTENATITFEDGETSKIVLISVLDDFTREGNETFQVSLSSATGGAVIGNRSTATVTIVDNELAGIGSFQFLPVRFSISETSRVANVVVVRTAGTNGPASVTFATEGVTATDGVDFFATNGVLNFVSGQVKRAIPVRLRDDALDETNETFQVFLTGVSSGAGLGSNTTATVTIVDNDAGGVLAFNRAIYTAGEAAPSALITVSRVGGRAEQVTVDFSTADISATEGADYFGTNGTLTFGSNQLSKTFSVPISQDSLAEGNETLALRLGNPTGGATLGSLSNAVLTIADDETSIALKSPAISMIESNRVVALTVTRSGPLTSTVSVGFATSNGSASTPADYRGTNGTLTFGPGIASRTILIPIVNDFVIEEDETFTFTLSNPTGGAQLGTVTSTVITITNDDFAGTIAFSSATYSGKEGTNAPIVIRRTGGLASGVTVQFTASAGTATAGTDFTALSTNVTFNGGEISKVVRVPTVFDNLIETNETVNLTLSSPGGGASLGTLSNAVLTIVNRPDPNAISGIGAPFMNLTVTGIEGNVLSKSMNITHNPAAQEVVGASYVTGLIQGLTGSKTTIALSGFSVVTTFHNFQFPSLTVSGPGRYPIYSNSSTGGAVWTYTVSTGQSLSYGTGKTGGGGTVIIDVLDAGSNTIAGRFDLVAVQTGAGTKKVRIKGSFRVKNVSGL